MNTEEIKDLKALLSKPKSIIIVPHKNPDGDAIGSSLALKFFLEKSQHKVTIVSPNDYPSFLKWIPGESAILKYDNDGDKAKSLIYEADLVFTLDFNHFSRTGNMESLLKGLDTTFVMIDHHQQPDDYAQFQYSDTSMSSTCQMIYHFIEKLGETDLIDADIATCIYVGIMTDTGSFRFRSTTAITHRILSDLIERGADNTSIHEKIYDSNSFSRLQLQGIALKNMKVLPESRAVYITLSQKELDDHHFKKGDTEGFVNIGLSLQGIIFSTIFIENKAEDIIKISFRSKGDFSVNEFARSHFEGGGHHNAAGGKSNLGLQETVDKFISILPSYKNELAP